jgi:hypothetical protein
MSESVEMFSPKAALIQWAHNNQVGTSDFAFKMGYTYSYAWSLLRGNAEVKPELIGRMAIAFGAESVKEIVAVMPAPKSPKKGTGPLPKA